MATKIKMWGNSLAVRIPKDISRRLNLKEGSNVTVDVRNKDLVIRQIEKKQPTLKELVDQITPQNRHKLVDFGEPVGNEIW